MEQTIPGLIVDPGLNANYRRGRTKRQLTVLHFTVGTNSYGIVKNNGLAAFLVPKVGVPWQFAPADAVTSHACEWNDEGAGIEFERLSWDDPLTPDQIHWGGVIARWYAEHYGIPLVLHDGPRLPIGSTYRGNVNHGSLVHQACDQHTDGVTQADFAAMVGAATTRRRYVPDMVILIAPNLDKTWTAFRVIGDTITREYPVQPVGAFGIPQAAIDDAGDNIAIKQATWDEVNLLKKITAIAQVVPTGGTAPSPDQVTADEAAAVAGQSATAAVTAAADKIGADTAKATKAGLA